MSCMHGQDTRRDAAPGRHGGSRAESAGFTLIELVVTVTIIIIIASVALPSYRQHMIRAHRGDATQALLRIAAEQEKFYLDNNTYADALDDTGLDIDAVSANGYYNLDTSGDAAGFTAEATPVKGKGQEYDSGCTEFSIDEDGTRGATDSNGDPNVEFCWR